MSSVSIFSGTRARLANNTDARSTVAANAGGINDGTFNFGRNNFSPRETTIKRNQIHRQPDILVQRNHTIKYGADLLFDQILNFFPGLFGGSYTFPSYAALSSSARNAAEHNSRLDTVRALPAPARRAERRIQITRNTVFLFRTTGV